MNTLVCEANLNQFFFTLNNLLKYSYIHMVFFGSILYHTHFLRECIWNTHNDYSIFTYFYSPLESQSKLRLRPRHIICAIKLIANGAILGGGGVHRWSGGVEGSGRRKRSLLCVRASGLAGLLRQSTSRFAQPSPNKFHWASLHSGMS